MGEFFRRWKRKIGMMTLVMACVLMGGWVRSTFVQDLLQIPNGKGSTLQGASAYSYLMLFTVQSDAGEEQMAHYGLNNFQLKDRGRVVRFGDTMFFARDDLIPTQPFKLKRGSLKIGPSEFTWQSYQIPYWSIVVPLTVISAWLLLSKPRKSTPKKFPEPTGNEGGA